ncbi:unnamed protein product [Parnassius apollo]|uniref:(apollo) hypothetical protein n=1 Tax=Parnassius apollo TaxID=110799 RepID=A0A8S3YAR3_PARAO|nr:unnamed protein product [Parnassius apollo]
MARFLHDDQIEGFLNGSGDEGIDDEEQQDMPFTGLETSILFPSFFKSQSSSSSDEDVPLSNLRWKKKKFHGKPIPGVSDPNAVLTPAQYFERYFTLEQFALATNQYYMTETGHQLKPVCTSGEIKKFFCIHGLMGCFSYPRIKLFWNQRYKFDPIASAMSRDRFFSSG